MNGSHDAKGPLPNFFAHLPWSLPAGLGPSAAAPSPAAGVPLPGLNEVNDFMRQAWSAMNLSPSLAPTLDIQELDKRIGDLKAVEQWLLLNLNMLRGSIQALEVQRATVATLQAFSDAAMSRSKPTEPASGASRADPQEPPKPNPSSPGTRSPTPPDAATEPMVDAAKAWWQMLQSQFDQISQAALATADTTTDRPGQSAPTGKSKRRRPTAARKRRPSSS